MNDTILNKRQQKILTLIKKGGKLTRKEVVDRLKKEWKEVAVITVARDLKHLINKKFIKTSGKARASAYSVLNKNPLLEYIDFDSYFTVDARERKVKSSFQAGTIKKLHDIFSEQERKELDRSAIIFKKHIKEQDKTFFKRELERFIIEFAWKSSQIEGNTYDLLETETLIKDHIEARGHTKAEAQMILNHKTAFDAVLSIKTQLKHLTFSKVTQLHNVLVAKLGITTGIRIREVKIIGTGYSPPVGREVLDSHLRAIVDLINKTKHPVEKAIIAAVMIPYLQPFMDGNKRTGRMLANAILLAHDYFPLSYRNVDVTEYKKAMILFYEQNNLYHFKRIFLEQYRFALGNYFL